MRSTFAALFILVAGCKKTAVPVGAGVDAGLAPVVPAATTRPLVPPAPEALVTGLANEGVLAVDAERAYWVDAEGLASVPKHGGGRTSLDPETTRAQVLFVDGADVYYGGHFGFSGLFHLHGAQLSPTRGRPVRCFAADRDAVYWLEMNQEPTVTDGLHGDLFRASKDGTTHTRVTRVDSGDSCAVDDTHVFWSETLPNGKHVVRAKAKADGAVKTLREVEGGPRGDHLRVDGSTLYWTASGAVMLAPKLGGPATRIELPARSCSLEDLAIDDGHVFVSCAGDVFEATGSIWRIPKAGGPPRCVAGNLPGPAGLAVDGESVYWAFRGVGYAPTRGGVARIAKDAPGVDDAACASK